MRYALVIAAILFILWVGRLLWGTLLYWGTPMLAVYFPTDDDFSRAQASMMEKLGTSAIGEGRVWTDRGRSWALRVVFMVNPDDQTALSKLVPLFQMSLFICGAVTTAKPAGALKFLELPLPPLQIPVTEDAGDEWQDDDEDVEWNAA